MKEYKEYKGKLDGTGKKFALIVARFNEFIGQELRAGAVDCLERHNVADIEIFWTAGAFEIPALAKRVVELGRFDAVLCLGAVIRGDTPHFDYIAAEAARGVAKVYYKTGVPTIFGIITADTIEQAIERAGTKSGNKGWDAALSGLELVNLQTQIR